jgi:L-ascorbate metabolism protein UlaG (beta-lactamase superfamily)
MNQKRIMPHVENGRFFNYPGETKESVVLRSVAMYCWGWRARNSRKHELAAWHVDQCEALAIGSYPNREEFRTTWIGHSTFLLEFSTINILTDPVFGDITLFFKRLQKPGLTLEALPKIDVVVISHNHRDHMDKFSLQAIARFFPNCVFYVPKGDRHWLNSWGIERVYEMNWYDCQAVMKGRVTFLPAVHWSQRSLFDFNRSLWGSWMIEVDGYSIYFAGDTAYGDHFAAIGREYTAIDYALMPIGPCEPKVWMQKSHISAEDAGKAFLELGAQAFIPMHWGTFTFGLDNPLLPIERIISWWQAAQPVQQLFTPKIGQQLLLTQRQPIMPEQKNSQTISV